MAPRGLAVDPKGHLYVADTGNKRIAVFDADGNYRHNSVQRASIPVNSMNRLELRWMNGNVYVTDTWNGRVQTFTQSADGSTFTPLKQWNVAGRHGQSLDNKPFIAVDNKGHVFITDPEGFRVIEYSTDGQRFKPWATDEHHPHFGLRLASQDDPQGNIWVSDAGNNRIMRFALP